ncbi:MAG: enoyl-CoA hydratase/isomerase family protein [Planctomycetota bacterium]
MIEFETADEVMVWTLSHGKANALDLEFLEQISDRLEQVRTSAARALVITGRDRIFCAGVDLVRLLDSGPDYVRRFGPALNRTLLSLATFPKPVVCAANGHAIAGGAVLLFAGDLRLMVPAGARIGVPELAVGVPFPTVAMELVRLVTSRAHVGAALWEARTYAPEDAKALGWIDELAPADGLRARAIARARDLAAIPAETFRLTKEHLRRGLVDFVNGPGATLDRRIQAAWESAEVLGAVRRYVDRTLRKPGTGKVD